MCPCVRLFCTEAIQTIDRYYDRWSGTAASAIWPDMARGLLALGGRAPEGLADLAVDGCIVKAPCGSEATDRSPVDRSKQGTKRSLLVDGNRIPLGCVIAGANCHHSPLPASTLNKLSRFEFNLPEQITVHPDTDYDSGKTRDLLDTLGCA